MDRRRVSVRCEAADGALDLTRGDTVLIPTDRTVATQAAEYLISSVSY